MQYCVYSFAIILAIENYTDFVRIKLKKAIVLPGIVPFLLVILAYIIE
ncbi:MAG: hypothetical protein AB2434_10995 [Caldanaerobacter subterraneus]